MPTTRDTFRLKRLRSERYTKPDDLSYRPSGEALQDFGYDYDLVGNILAIRDRTPGSGILNNPEAAQRRRSGAGAVAGERQRAQPPLRLRPHLSPALRHRPRVRPPARGRPWEDQPRCTDLTKARAYTEQYRYDADGQHAAPGAPQWHRRLHPRVHGRETGQQPPAPRGDRRHDL